MLANQRRCGHLVLRPCGVTLSVALFGKGQGGSNPSVPYFEGMLLSATEPNFYGIFFCFLIYSHARFAKKPSLLNVIDTLAPFPIIKQ